MQDKIICLVGASGSGKTTIAQELEKMRYNIIISYTTREPRGLYEWGHTFITDWFPVFVSKTFVGIENGEDPEELPCKFKYIDIDEMIAYKEIYGDHYFATKEQYQGKGTSIYIVCPDGARQVRQNVKDVEIVTIFLMADVETRCQRIHARMFPESKYNWRMNPGLILPRVRNDEEIFSKCRCDFVVDANRDIDLVVFDILEIIEQGEW